MRLRVNFDLSDCMVLSGLATFAYGLWQIYQPAAFLFIGFALFKLGTAGDQ